MYSSLILLLALCVGLMAQSTGLIGTSNEVRDGNNVNPAAIGCSQTFTILNEGHLMRVQVQISAPTGGTLTYKLLPTLAAPNPGGMPDLNAPIFSDTISLASDSSFQWIDLDLTGAYQALSPGDTLAIIVETSTTCWLAGAEGNPCATGTLWLDTQFGFLPAANQDLAFRVYRLGSVLAQCFCKVASSLPSTCRCRWDPGEPATTTSTTTAVERPAIPAACRASSSCPAQRTVFARVPTPSNSSLTDLF